MIELPLNADRYERMIERLLVPKRIWKGGWYVTVWNSRARLYFPAGTDVDSDLEYGPFLRHEEKAARAYLACLRALYPRRRFRLQRIGAPWLISFYSDIVRDSDDPERAQWFEKWGGGSPLWRMLGRQPK